MMPRPSLFSHCRQRPSTIFIGPTTLVFLLLLCQAPSRVRTDCYDCNDVRSKSPIQSTSFTDGSSYYSNNLDCCWLIQPGYNGIELSFSHFQTERRLDTVRIYDGPSTSSALIATYSGSSIPDSVATNGGSLLVRFTTDSSVVETGFAASYQRHYSFSSSSSYCTATALFDSSGIESRSESPYFSSNRDDVLLCWHIQPGYSGIRLELNPEYVLDYFGDELSFFSSSTRRNSSYIGTVSYNETRRSRAPDDRMVIRSPANHLLVVARLSYYSDLSYYWDPSYLSYLYSTSPITGAIDDSYSRDTGTGCISRTTLTADSGSFTDGSAADGRYPSFLSCSWLLIAPSSGQQIRLTFQNLDTQPINDEVRVYDGSETSSPLIGAFSGSSRPTDTITSTGSSLLVTFVTNSLGSGRGFSVSYQTFIQSSIIASNNLGLLGSVTLQGMPGMSDVPEQQQAFQEAIAEVAGEAVYVDQVEIDDIADCSSSESWWLDGCAEVAFRVTGIATEAAEVELVAVRIMEAVALSADDDRSLASVLEELSGVPSVRLVDMEFQGVLDASDGSSLILSFVQEEKEFGLEGRVELEGMPGVADMREQQQDFREAIARVSGVTVEPEQVKIINVVDCGPKDEWWNEGCSEVTFLVTHVSTNAILAEVVADRIREAARAPVNYESSLGSVLRDLSGMPFVTVTEMEVTVLKMNDESPLTLPLILGVSLGAVCIFGALVLSLQWQRLRIAMKNQIFSVNEEKPADVDPTLLSADSRQAPAETPIHTPIEPITQVEEATSETQSSRVSVG